MSVNDVQTTSSVVDMKRDFLAEMTVAPAHPGAVFARIVLPELDLTHLQAADRLGLGEQDFEAFLTGAAKVDDRLASSLGELCGNGPDLWLRMQASLDDWRALHRA